MRYFPPYFRCEKLSCNQSNKSEENDKYNAPLETFIKKEEIRGEICSSALDMIITLITNEHVSVDFYQNDWLTGFHGFFL